MSLPVCAFPRCRKTFEPAFGQEEMQKFCSPECRNADGQRRWRERHKQKPNGGGPPGGNRQARLFSRSELHRRKPAKSALKPKPKQDDLLFPDKFPVDRHDLPADGGLYTTFCGAVRYRKDGSVSDNGAYNTYSVKSGKLSPQSIPAAPEAPVAA